MSNNSERIATALAELRYRTSPFTAPEQQGGAAGVRFPYRIEDGSRAGETVTLALAMHQNEGEWPEVAPHWLYLSPPDPILAELVKGSRSPGAIQTFQCAGGHDWMAVNGGAKLVHPGGAKLVHLTLCGTRCWGVVPVVHRRDPRCFV